MIFVYIMSLICHFLTDGKFMIISSEKVNKLTM